jgi:hypothetical protein
LANESLWSPALAKGMSVYWPSGVRVHGLLIVKPKPDLSRWFREWSVEVHEGKSIFNIMGLNGLIIRSCQLRPTVKQARLSSFLKSMTGNFDTTCEHDKKLQGLDWVVIGSTHLFQFIAGPPADGPHNFFFFFFCFVFYLIIFNNYYLEKPLKPDVSYCLSP